MDGVFVDVQLRERNGVVDEKPRNMDSSDDNDCRDESCSCDWETAAIVSATVEKISSQGELKERKGWENVFKFGNWAPLESKYHALITGHFYR